MEHVKGPYMLEWRVHELDDISIFCRWELPLLMNLTSGILKDCLGESQRYRKNFTASFYLAALLVFNRARRTHPQMATWQITQPLGRSLPLLLFLYTWSPPFYLRFDLGSLSQPLPCSYSSHERPYLPAPILVVLLLLSTPAFGIFY